MSSSCCVTILHVSIWAVLILTSDASGPDDEDSKCETEIKVRRHTMYEVLNGADLRINCIITFCNNTPPPVSWFQLWKTTFLVDFKKKSHIRTEWNTLNHLEGISSLVFDKIRISDSGWYQCHSEGSVSHSIGVFVYDTLKSTTVTRTTQEHKNLTQDSLWLFVYFFAGITVLVIVAVAVYVILILKSVCKGVRCERSSRTKTNPDPENGTVYELNEL